jgi:4-amino-4-deoxy-L-arabinose transferase-like glycosyltransferase
MERVGSEPLAPEMNMAGPAGTACWAVAVFVLVLLLGVPQAALLPSLDRDEPRFAEASREMLQSGNLIVPTFDHQPRYAKPPLIYWAQAAAYEFFGESAFSARLPSLLATAGTAVLLLIWGVDLANLPAGLIAALAYAFCFQAMQQGRVATADALLIFFVALTVFAGWKLLAAAEVGRGWNLWGLVFTLGLTGGFLGKGPEAFLPALPLFWILRRGGARVLLALAAMVFLALLIVSAWAIPAYTQTDGAYWREGLGNDVAERMVTGFQGHGASSFGWYLLGLPLYFLIFWVSALPWSPLLLIWRRRLFSGWRPDRTDIYLLLNAGLFFAVFSLMVTKLPHYTLPAFPFLGLLFARRWTNGNTSGRLPIFLTLGCGTIFALAALILVPIALSRGFNPSPAGQLVREAGAALKPATEFALVDFNEPNAVWEMRRVVRGYSHSISGNEVVDFLGQPGSRAVLLTSAGWKRIAADRRPPWRVFSARGWNAAKGSALDLILVINGE